MATADFTIADVLAWARTKPADEVYNYISSSDCAMCQFLIATNRASRPSLADNDWYDLGGGGGRHFFDIAIKEAAQGPDEYDLSDEVRWTFGAFVRRLEALCPETPVTLSNWQTIDAYLEGIDAPRVPA